MIKKTSKLLLLSACFMALALTSCKKEGCTDSKAKNYNSEAEKDDGSCLYDAPNPPSVTLKTFTAKIDGDEFIETSVSGELDASYNTITIEAEKGAKYLGLAVPDDISPGTYNFESYTSGTISSFYFDGNNVYEAEAGEGTLKIVSRTSPTASKPGKISGTFSYTAVPITPGSGNATYTVTDGEFNIAYE